MKNIFVGNLVWFLDMTHHYLQIYSTHTAINIITVTSNNVALLSGGYFGEESVNISFMLKLEFDTLKF